MNFGATAGYVRIEQFSSTLEEIHRNQFCDPKQEMCRQSIENSIESGDFT